jgi:hypothetical protein
MMLNQNQFKHISKMAQTKKNSRERYENEGGV